MSYIEGFVDLAFREAGRWTVVEVKTDLPSGSGEGLPAGYHAQLASTTFRHRRAPGASRRRQIWLGGPRPGQTG